ncbi:MAG: hypothetical protein KatS3mg054_0141 [Chloroflexus sp.]|nr:MAG: hypothetical protein KatS3mg054_0141 [Chloroflexus sp.]
MLSQNLDLMGSIEPGYCISCERWHTAGTVSLKSSTFKALNPGDSQFCGLCKNPSSVFPHRGPYIGLAIYSTSEALVKLSFMMVVSSWNLMLNDQDFYRSSFAEMISVMEAASWSGVDRCKMCQVGFTEFPRPSDGLCALCHHGLVNVAFSGQGTYLDRSCVTATPAYHKKTQYAPSPPVAEDSCIDLGYAEWYGLVTPAFRVANSIFHLDGTLDRWYGTQIMLLVGGMPERKVKIPPNPLTIAEGIHN